MTIFYRSAGPGICWASPLSARSLSWYQLVRLRSFEHPDPLSQPLLVDTEGRLRQISIAPGQAIKQLVLSRACVMHLAACPKPSRPSSVILALVTAPEPVLQDHIDAKHEDLRRQIPQRPLNRIARRVERLARDVPAIEA